MEKKIKKRTKKQIAANLVILTGILCVMGGIWMSSGGYLWRALFDKVGISYSKELPDPAGSEDTPWLTEAEVEEFLLADSSSVSTLPGEEKDTYVKAPENDGPEHLKLVGFCKIPKLGVSKNIYLGSDNPQMKYGIGLMDGTALPGMEGNCTLAGHRSSLIMEPFRHIDTLKKGDEIWLVDQTHKYIYEVFDSFVVEPKEVWIKEPIEGEKSTVTLLTCTPLGISTQRLIVRGRLVSTDVNKHTKGNQ